MHFAKYPWLKLSFAFTLQTLRNIRKPHNGLGSVNCRKDRLQLPGKIANALFGQGHFPFKIGEKLSFEAIPFSLSVKGTTHWVRQRKKIPKNKQFQVDFNLILGPYWLKSIAVLSISMAQIFCSHIALILILIWDFCADFCCKMEGKISYQYQYRCDMKAEDLGHRMSLYVE